MARVTYLEQKSGHSPPPICHCQHPNNRHLLSSKLLRCPPHPTLTPGPLLSSQGGSQAGPSVGRWEACGHPHMAAETPVSPRPPVLAPGGGAPLGLGSAHGLTAPAAMPVLRLLCSALDSAPGSSDGACAQSSGVRGMEGRGADRPHLSRPTPYRSQFPTLGTQPAPAWWSVLGQRRPWLSSSLWTVDHRAFSVSQKESLLSR